MILHQQAICPVCRTEFDVAATGRKPKYCSDKCKMKAYRNRNKESVTKPDVDVQTMLKGTSWRAFNDTNNPAPGASVFFFIRGVSGNISFSVDETEVSSKLQFVESYDPQTDYGEILFYTVF